jgi:tellurium resistance protein TerD
MDDILDTRYEGKDVELNKNMVKVGDEINLASIDMALHMLHVGVGWDLNTFDADALDLDFSAFLIGKEDKTRMDEDFVFYNNPKSLGDSVKHMGDSRSGAGDGDDECVTLDLRGLSFDVMKVVFAISLYRGEEKQQTLAKVNNSYLRLVNIETTHELCRFDLTKEFEDKNHTAMIVGVLVREGPKWHFLPQAESVEGGLAAIATRYGCTIIQS